MWGVYSLLWYTVHAHTHTNRCTQLISHPVLHSEWTQVQTQKGQILHGGKLSFIVREFLCRARRGSKGGVQTSRLRAESRQRSNRAQQAESRMVSRADETGWGAEGRDRSQSRPTVRQRRHLRQYSAESTQSSLSPGAKQVGVLFWFAAIFER